MPRDERGKNRKFGHHRDRAVKDISEKDMLEKEDDSDEEE
jgi:hypothetical protein